MVPLPSGYLRLLSVEFCQELRADQAASVCRMVVVVVVVVVVVIVVVVVVVVIVAVAASACKWILT